MQIATDANDRAELLGLLADRGYPAHDLTDDEVAKLHIRHMVGGRAPQVSDEIVYRFEFPERPGALMQFLSRLGQGWNISMFHYRNHGSAYGRVLVGMQVPRQDRGKLRKFLQDLQYPFSEETDNPAYRQFLV